VVRKKSAQKFGKRPIARKKHPPKRVTNVIIGVDISMSSIALAGQGYDGSLKKNVGPEFVICRWGSGVHYFERITDSATGHNFILDVLAELKLSPELDEVYIAVEEPWPFGITSRTQSNALKQQAEISGAFLGSLLRYGWKNIFQIQANSWRQIVAADLDITIHHTKWRSPELALKYNCKPEDSGKFRSKQWALLSSGIPDWPDIISSKQGKIPRPEGSKAKAVQPDDRYDALAIMTWMRMELDKFK
jgi:hypothetical protein